MYTYMCIYTITYIHIHIQYIYIHNYVCTIVCIYKQTYRSKIEVGLAKLAAHCAITILLSFKATHSCAQTSFSTFNAVHWSSNSRNTLSFVQLSGI